MSPLLPALGSTVGRAWDAAVTVFAGKTWCEAVSLMPVVPLVAFKGMRCDGVAMVSCG